MRLNTYLMPLLSNFELLTPLLAPLGKVKVLDPSDFGEVAVLPARASYKHVFSTLSKIEDFVRKKI